MICYQHLKRVTINTISSRRYQSLSLFRPSPDVSVCSSYKQLTKSNFYDNHYFHTSVACRTRHNETTTGEDDDHSKEWIPPSRPLTGDSSQSRLHVEATIMKEDEIGEETRAFLEKQSVKSGEESVHFVDLTDLDPETIKYSSAPENIEYNNSMWEQLPDDDDDDDDDDYNDLFNLNENDQDHIENDVSKEEDWTQDAVIREFINDPDFDNEDEEMVQLQGQLIAERIRDLRIKKKKDLPSSPKTKVDLPIGEVSSSSDLDNFLKDQNFQGNKSLSSSSNGSSASVEKDQPDWLRTRRSKLAITSSHRPTEMLTPKQAELVRKNDAEIPIIKHTLLSTDEIISCLKRLGARDTVFVQPEENTRALLGWDGLIIATGSSNSHIRTLVDAIVMNLRRRDLADNGVIGAKYGPEGGNAEMSAKKRRKMGHTKRGKRAGDAWMVVDCLNYLVHVQDNVTRRSIDLEGLWSPGERGHPGRDLRRINAGDEDQVDEYVAANPIPDEYAESLITMGENFWSDGSGRGGFGNRSLKTSARWTPVGQKKKKISNSRQKNRL